MSMAAIFLCDLTGNMAEPWALAGVECWCVDVQHSIRKDRIEGRIHYVWGDVRSWCPPPGIDIVFAAAFPPCTDVSGSGARDWSKKGNYRLTDALELFTSCQMALSWSGAPFLIENPVGALSRHMGQPDHTFHPWEYAGWLDDPQEENSSKRTCLWTGGGFIMPEARPAPGLHRQDVWLATPSDERANIRSATPRGFARAVFEANRPDRRRIAA